MINVLTDRAETSFQVESFRRGTDADTADAPEQGGGCAGAREEDWGVFQDLWKEVWVSKNGAVWRKKV